MQFSPCLHLIPIEDGREGSCHIGRAFPNECTGCKAYVPGINESERQRCEVWFENVMDCGGYDAGSD